MALTYESVCQHDAALAWLQRKGIPFYEPAAGSFHLGQLPWSCTKDGGYQVAVPTDRFVDLVDGTEAHMHG